MRFIKEKKRIGEQGKIAAQRNGMRGSEMTDYRRYSLSLKEYVWCAAAYAVLDGMISYLFYRSWIAFFVFLPGALFFFREWENRLSQRRREELEKQFLYGMQAVSTSLSAGYSIENAIEEACKELKKSMNANAIILNEFTRIKAGLGLNQTMEELTQDLAERSGVEDIESFAQVFTAAKRSGGDLVAIIRNTVQSIYQRQETRQEIIVCLAAKRMEQNVMCLTPFFILFYVQLTSPGFLDILYHNMIGCAVMTGCLAVYFFSWWLGRKIVMIEV